MRMSDNKRPDPSIFPGIASFDRKASLKQTVAHVTNRDGSIVEETLNGESYKHRSEVGKIFDMSYLERQASPPIDNGTSSIATAQIQRLDNIPLDPNAAWQQIQHSQIFHKVPTIASTDSLWNTPHSDCTRIVCMSDTHGQHDNVLVPKGDILIHAGDFSNTGEIQQCKDTARFFQQLAFSTTICIAGNHDLTLDLPYYDRSWRRFHRTKMNAMEGRRAMLQLMQDTTSSSANSSSATASADEAVRKPRYFYLEDTACIVPIRSIMSDESYKVELERPKHDTTTDDRGSTEIKFDPSVVVHKAPKFLSIYGSPWTPEFYDWAFNLQRGQPSWDTWAKIPKGTDVLVTHGPPLGRSDLCSHGGRAGCFDLLEHVQKRVRPRLHVFGHIHEAFGATYDGTTLYVNASNLDLKYQSVHPCTVIDLPHDPNLPPRIVTPQR
jgi:Calcineurin-like phosphoesterase